LPRLTLHGKPPTAKSVGSKMTTGVPSVLDGGGAAGALVRATDWSRTPVGPIPSWPSSLRLAVGMVLHSRHPMFIWWGSELVQFYNDAYIPSFGRGKHPAAMGQRGRECWREVWPIIGPQIEDVMTRGVPSWHEDALVPIFRNGRIEEVYWTYGYSPLFDDDGSIGGTLVVCTETTHRVVAQRRLATVGAVAEAMIGQEDLVAIVLAAVGALERASPDLPFVVACESAPSDATPRLLRAVGLSNPRLESDIAPVAQVVRSAAPYEIHLVSLAGVLPEARQTEREPPSEAFAVRLGDKIVVVFAVSPSLPLDDTYRAFVKQLVTSIQAAIERSDALRSRARVEGERRNLLLQAPVATALLTGPKHRYELANERYVAMVGREVVGKDYLEAFPEVAGTPLADAISRVYRTGTPFVAQEFRVSLNASGSDAPEDRYFRFNLEPLRDDSGVVYGMMCLALDITDEVRARLALEKGTEERDRLLARLEAANRAKDEFLAMLGHELRNPLAPILTAAELLRRNSALTGRREVDVIQRQASHLAALLDDLFDVARVAAGKVTLAKRRIALRDVIAQAVEMGTPLLEKKRHVLRLEVPSDISIVADPQRMAQVFANLITNAAKYTDAEGNITIHAAREGDRVVVRVVDNGIGIPPDQRAHLFDAFFQVSRPRGRSEGGLGLGLALVKSLVELHGGEVTAFSAGPGEGSTFVVVLPTENRASDELDSRAAPGRNALARSDGGPAVKPRRVLLVDDNEDLAELLADVLRQAGHVVEVAHDGPSALARVVLFHPEVAVLDIGLPVMDGYALAAELRSAMRDGAPKLIAVSGYGQAIDRELSKRAGFAAHLVKPVDFAALEAAIGEG
jgi:signal transduction histidine kinase/CheY-like chemotaxis protein